MKKKTMEEELTALEIKMQAELKHIERKYAVLSSLPDLGEYAPPSIHSGTLYGSVGSLHFQRQRYSSIAEGKSPDAALLGKLLVAVPPVDLVLFKGGCTSIRPEPEAYTNNGEYREIGPVTVEVDPTNYSQTTAVKWFGALAGDIWGVSVEFPIHQPKIGELTLSYARYSRGNGEISSVTRCEFRPKDPTAHIIKWASGDRKTPNHFTIYWGRGRNVNIPELFT